MPAQEKSESGLKKLASKALQPLEDIGLKKENIMGTEEYDEKVDMMDEARVVYDEWNDGETLYHQLLGRLQGYRDFYKGETHEQWANSPEGELQLVFNLGATIIDLFTYILGNSPPSVQFRPNGTEPMQLVRADFAEDLIEKIFDNAKFAKRFKEGVKNQVWMGFAWPLWIWNKDNKDGGKKGTLELTMLNPFRTRVKYSSLDSEEIESVITMERVSPKEVYKRYKFEALPDSQDPYVPEDIPAQDDGMATILRRYGPNTIRTVVNGRQVAIKKTDYDFVPAVQVDNVKILNDVHGYGEISRWQGIAQEINELLTAASEIARDLGYPPIIEYNNALGGRKVPKWRGRKIPAKANSQNQGIEYLINPAQIGPLLAQAEFLLDLFHFVSLMPKAAAGVFEPSITSGFQAKLAMQPATLSTEARKVDWEEAIKDMVKYAIKILEKENPEALQVKQENGDTIKFEDLALHEMEVVWPDNLPLDIAREIQNLILGLQNNLTSVRQAVDKYNVLMGMGSPSDTEEYLKQESQDPEVNPERATKVAQAKASIQQLSQNLNMADNKLQELRNQMKSQGERTPKGAQPDNIREANRQANPTNLQRSADQPLPEEERSTSASAEGVPPESTGGVVPQDRRGQR